MRSLALVVACIDGGSDGPPDLSIYFRTTAYANAVCNTVDQQLAGERWVRRAARSRRCA